MGCAHVGALTMHKGTDSSKDKFINSSTWMCARSVTAIVNVSRQTPQLLLQGWQASCLLLTNHGCPVSPHVIGQCDEAVLSSTHNDRYSLSCKCVHTSLGGTGWSSLSLSVASNLAIIAGESSAGSCRGRMSARNVRCSHVVL
jgi:hypothetical protein